MKSENLTRDEARTRAALLEVSTYDVALDLTTGTETFRSTTTVRFTAKEPEASTFIDLIAAGVRSATLNGEDLDVSGYDQARVALPNLAADNELVVDADCRYMNTGEGLHRFVDPVDDEVYLYSQFEVADTRRMFTVFEQPDLKARFTFTITAPENWLVVSNSPTPEPAPAGGGVATWSFAETEILPCYITALIAGGYKGATGELTSSDGRTIPLGVYARASLAEHLDVENILDITKRGFTYYEGLFDTPYPFPKYDQMFVPEYNMGAMENAGAVTFLEGYVFRSQVTEAMVERRALTILHELAHMWFGNLVTMRWWDDLWLNESFAEFISTLAMAEATDWTAAWTTFSSMEKSWAVTQDQLPSTHPIGADMVDLEAVETNFDGITYAKGASVLKQLVAYVGRDHFMAGLRAYFRKHRFGNTELKDLLAELEATSGRDLSTWSDLWLSTAGVNLLRPVIAKDADGLVTDFAIRQESADSHPTLRPHRLVVGGYTLTDGALVRTVDVGLDIDGEVTEVPDLVGKRADFWLVNDEDLAYAKIRLDPESLATAIEHLDRISDSLARTLVWSAAWDMTRDAEMPAQKFVRLLLANIGAESDSSVVQTLLRQLTTTVRMYVDPGARADIIAGTASGLLDLAQQADAGSDSQFQLVKVFAQLASTAEHADALESLRSGKGSLEGLTVDTDLNWEIVQALASLGRLDADAIDSVLAADDTQTGRKAAATARAAIPTAEVKAGAWRATMEESGLANETLTAIVQGFWRGADLTLVEPYVEKYFAVIADVWGERSGEIADRLALGYFPSRFATNAIADAAGEWLEAHPDAPFGLRRIMTEGRDGVLRAVRAQAADLPAGA